MGWIVGCIPDILGITKTNFTEIWHGNFESLRPSTVDIPSIFLPNVSEITHMSTHEKEDRQHFWISAIAFAFFATILVGQTLICLITASKSLKWCNGKDPVFEKLDDLEADFDGRGEKSSRSFQKIENALEADFDGTPEKSSRSNSLTWPRTLVAVSFAGNLLASCYALAMSKDSKQISKKYGIDWEYYFMLFVGCGLWTIAQAAWATWNLAPEESLTLTSFGQACFASMAPIISDHYDTLKDAMFAFLCLESGSSAVQIMGWVSLLYLIGLHAYLIGFDEDALAELAESHLSGLQMTTKLKDGNSQPVPLKTEMWEFVVFTTYKQMTPTKRRLLLLENFPQAMFAVIYLLYEGGSMPVTIMNLGLPCVQTAVAWIFFGQIRAIAGPLIGSKLRKFLLARQQLRLRRLFNEVGEEYHHIHHFMLFDLVCFGSNSARPTLRMTLACWRKQCQPCTQSIHKRKLRPSELPFCLASIFKVNCSIPCGWNWVAFQMASCKWFCFEGWKLQRKRCGQPMGSCCVGGNVLLECRMPVRKIDLSWLHIDRVIGLPNHFPHEGI